MNEGFSSQKLVCLYQTERRNIQVQSNINKAQNSLSPYISKSELLAYFQLWRTQRLNKLYATY